MVLNNNKSNNKIVIENTFTIHNRMVKFERGRSVYRFIHNRPKCLDILEFDLGI